MKWHDDYLGMIDYGRRWYYPRMGRWINRDPIGEEGGENLYGFCENDPLSLADFGGLLGTCVTRTLPKVDLNEDWELWKVIPDAFPLSATVSPSVSYVYILQGIDVKWRLKGSVNCSCSIDFGLFKHCWTSHNHTKPTTTSVGEWPDDLCK